MIVPIIWLVSNLWRSAFDAGFESRDVWPTAELFDDQTE